MTDYSKILAAIDPPVEPLTSIWEVSAVGLVRRIYDVPSIASKALGQVDRLGAVRIGPDALGFDRDDVAWNKITVVRTRRMSEVLTDTALEREVERLRKTLPPVPGRKWVLEKVANALGDLCRSALDRAGSDALTRQIVSEVGYRGPLGRNRTLAGGLVATAVFGVVPEANRIVLATAQRAGAEVDQD